MVLSKVSLIRTVVIPYFIILSLFLLVAGGGSVWLYYRAREAQAQVLFNDLFVSLSPVLDILSEGDVDEGTIGENSRLQSEVESAFSRLPALLRVRLRSPDSGVVQYGNSGSENITKENIAGYGTGFSSSANVDPLTSGTRLYKGKDRLLLVEFPVSGKQADFLLELGFNRLLLQDRVRVIMGTMVQAAGLLVVMGFVSLFISFMVAFWAVKRSLRLEAKMQELYRRASAAELMAGLVHDLRNPLASFRANMGVLKIASGHKDEILSDMDRDLVRLDDKLTAMLDLTRKRDEKAVSVDLAEMLQEVAALARPALAKNGLDLRIDCRVSGKVELMSNLFRDVLLNLFLNSGESGQKNGEILVVAEKAMDGLLVKVIDQGDGIAEGIDIFAPFVTTKSDGHGLGLAISKRTVEAHGGWIKACNRKEGGAIFIIWLPQPLSQRR